jgi:hypothetical protein
VTPKVDAVLGLVAFVAASQGRLDRRRRVHPRPDVQRVVVVGESDFHAIGRPRPFDRLLLHEVRQGGDFAPRGLVQPPVEVDRPVGDPDGLRLLPSIAVGVVLLREGGRRQEDEDQDQE